MALDPVLNSVLKEMWRLDEVLSDGVSLSEREKVFYNENLEIIRKYYSGNSEYWHSRRPI